MPTILKEIEQLLLTSKKRGLVNIENDLKKFFDRIWIDKNLESNIIEVILYIISELADNIKEHSRADYWQMAFSENKNDLTIFISDNGIGIPRLFANYFPEDISDDWKKILKAIEQGVSTKGEGRGFGLRSTKQLVKALSGQIIFISGGFGFVIEEDKIKKIKTSHKGTIVLIKFPSGVKIEKSRFYSIIEGKDEQS